MIAKKVIVLLYFGFFLTTSTIQAQDSTRYESGNYKLHNGTTTELTLVYIGADSCSPCHLPSLKSAIEKLKVILNNRAETQNKEFSAVGIANDFSVKKGWEFLNSTGYFDEVIIGKNWLNSGSIEFIWNHDQPEPSMPQIIVFEREVNVGEFIQVGQKKYLARYAGSAEIEEWVNSGADFTTD